MAWESVRVLDSDFPVGYTENDYYFTGNRSASHSGSQGGFSDITFVLSFSLRDYSGSAGDSYFYNQPAGDYYLVGDSNAGIFVRKTGNAQSNSGTITVKASYNGQADSGSTMPENLSTATSVRSGYSGLYMQFSIICGINEETHKGTIFTYRKWNGWVGRNDDYQIIYCNYDRYTNSEVAYNLIKGIMPVLGITSNGGGATHIAKVTGQLKDLSSNLSDILMVSGGGGGGLLVGEDVYAGADAGGISGSGSNSANQSTGYAFGQGENGTDASGGGSGLYGGYKGTSSKSGGAGSGYIGNSLLSNKKMVGYNVPTSDAEGTKTESVNEISASAVANKPKSGNGFARIKFLRDNPIISLRDIMKTTDNTHYKTTSSDNINDLSEYFGTDYLLTINGFVPSGVEFCNGIYDIIMPSTGGIVYIPVKKVRNTIRATASAVTSLSETNAYLGFAKVVNNRMEIVGEQEQHVSWTPEVRYDISITNEDVDYIIVRVGSISDGWRVHFFYITLTREES